jgi:Ca2+-binding RTX toxin-like protein
MSGQGINQPWMIGAGQATSSPNLLNNVDQHFQGSVSMFQLSDTVDNTGGEPDANPDTATTEEDTPVTIPVLGNDTDPTGQPLTVTSADAPNGTVTLNPNGTITYTPDPNYNGPDTITYTIRDPDGNTSTSTVAVTVTPVNDAPEANPDTSTTPFNTPVTFAVLGNDTDVDGDTLTISGTPTSPNGTVTVNPNGTLTFTPTPGFTGAAVVNYTIVDEEGLTDVSTWAITVGAAGGRDGIVRGTTGDNLIDAGYIDPFDADRVDANDALLPGEVGNDDIIEAGAGNDTVLAGDGNDDVRGDAGNDSVNGGAGDDSVQGGLGDDSIFGDAGNDTLVGDAGNDEIVGGLGDDSILGGIGNDALQGNEGNDTLRGDAGNDNILGGAGNDLVAGGTGDDIILGGLGNDVVVGDDGNDTLQGNIGDDSIIGGLGNDSIIGNEGSDTVDGGDGDDLIDTSGTAPLPDIDYPGVYGADSDPANDRDLVTGGVGNDTILTGDDADTIVGGAGNDVIDSGIDADLVEGGIGNDTIVGSEGADTIDGGDGNDLIYGGLNDVLGEALDLPDAVDLRPDNNRDLLTGGVGDDTIFGRDDDDTLFGGAGNDVLEGGIDEDSLVGGAGNDTLRGGQGSDNMAGGNDRDSFFITVQEHGLGDVIDGNEGGDDFDTLNLTGAGPLRIVYDPTNPENGTVTFLDADRNPTGTLAFTNIENVIPCFTPGTLIATPKGEVPVEHLKAGDRVITRDNGIQEIRWLGHKNLGWRDLAANPHLKPVLIRQGSLGNGLPERDMMVSPNHRMLVANDRTALYFDEHEVLVSAKHLVAANGIQSIDSIGTTYIHFMFDRHEVVLGNGAWTESFQPGDLTLKGMGNAQRAEIFELFPELQTEAGQNDYQAARRTLKKHEARLLVK